MCDMSAARMVSKNARVIDAWYILYCTRYHNRDNLMLMWYM